MLEQQWDLMLNAKKDAAEIDVDNSIPFLFSYLCGGLDGVFDTCIVEGKVETSEGFDGLSKTVLHIFCL